jgi:hypothetical protein
MKRSRRWFGTVGGGAALVALVSLLVVSSASGRSTAVPTNTKEPVIAAPYLVEVGTTLQGERGLWTGTEPISFTYKWLRCNADAQNCKAISGATATSYKITSSDVLATIRFEVKASNSDGATTADSNPTNQIQNKPGAPLMAAPPVVNGKAVVGKTLTATTGQWHGHKPISFVFNWQTCTTETSCKGNGATGNTYTVAQSDLGKRVRVKVTATNDAGKTVGLSWPTDEIQASGGGGGGTTTTVPPGGSIPVGAVPANQRLVVDTVEFSPNPVTSRSTPITVRIRVKDTEGHLVSGALVFLRSTPIVTSTPTDAPTGNDGWVTYKIQPESDFPIKTGYSVQFYVKAYRQGEPTLGGIYGSRLVQVATKS